MASVFSAARGDARWEGRSLQRAPELENICFLIFADNVFILADCASRAQQRIVSFVDASRRFHMTWGTSSLEWWRNDAARVAAPDERRWMPDGRLFEERSELLFWERWSPDEATAIALVATEWSRPCELGGPIE